MRERFSISIDEDAIKSIASLSAQTGLTKSFIVGKYIKEGLKNDIRLSSAERYFWMKKIILEQIDILFSAIGYSCRTSDISHSMLILYSIPEDSFESEKEYSLYRLSLFQLIDKIQAHDKHLHEKIINSLKKYNLKVSKNSELSEDIKPSETSLLPARVPDITIYNTCKVESQSNTTDMERLEEQSKVLKIERH